MTNIQQFTKINDAVLTREAIDFIAKLQDDDNHMVNNYINVLGDTIAHFGREINVGEQQDKNDMKFNRFISELSYLYDELKNLRKP